MEVEKKLSVICEKMYNETHTKKDKAILFFFNTFYAKRTEAYLKEYLDKEDVRLAGLKATLDKLEKQNKPAIPKFKSGDSVYLLVKDHDNRPYTIYSIHINQNNKIGYTYIDEEKVVSNYIYPEALFVYRNTGRLDVDKTSFEDLLNDLKAKDESWA
jgi:hypothetical protein